MIKTVVLLVAAIAVAIGLTQVDGVDGPAGFVLGYAYGTLAGSLTVAVAIARGWWDW